MSLLLADAGAGGSVTGTLTQTLGSLTLGSSGALAITGQLGAGASSTLPTFQAAGTLVGSTGTISPAWPTHAVDDIALLFIETANQIPTSLTTANGFALVGTLSYGGGVAGTGADSSSLDVYWCRATSTSMAAPTVADSGQHTIGQILTFSGCITTGNPWDVVDGDASGSASTSVTIPGVTTTVDNCLVVLACSWADDSASGSLATVTNASLANITSRVDAGNISGNGGGFAVLTGEAATAGVVSSSTGTLALGVASHQGRACIALKGVAGTAGYQLGALTSNSAGAVAITGATAATLDDVALLASGELTSTAIAGTLTATLGALTLSSSNVDIVRTTTAPTLRALLIANIAAIDATSSPGFRAYRHDQGADFFAWADRNPAGALRRFSVRDYAIEATEGVNQSNLEWRRVQFRIAVAYPHNNRAGQLGTVSRDEQMRSDRHAIDVATGIRAYASLETLPAVCLSATASRQISEACDFLVIDAVYGFFHTPV